MGGDTVLLMSGGLDSGYLALADQRVALGVFVDYGQRPAAQEEVAARRQAAVCDIEFVVVHTALPAVMVDDTEHGYGTIIPGRNAALLALGVSFAAGRQLDRVIFGANADDAAAYPDCRPEFVEAFDTLSSEFYGVRVYAPLLGWTKRDIAEHAGDSLAAVWSCYRGDPFDLDAKPCGECAACHDLD